MRFPIDPIPPVSAGDDLYEIQQTSGIRPLQRVGAHPQPPLIAGPRRQPRPSQRNVDADTRKSDERRQRERRKYTQVIMVDTRLGRDRRQERRRPSDPPPPSINEKV